MTSTGTLALRNGAASYETIEGRIELRNDNGIRLSGAWFNYSQYAPPLLPHEKGDEVRLRISRGKWIESLEQMRESEGRLTHTGHRHADGPRTAPAHELASSARILAAGEGSQQDRQTGQLLRQMIARLAQLEQAVVQLRERHPDDEPPDYTDGDVPPARW